jgi:hypothetical protein
MEAWTGQSPEAAGGDDARRFRGVLLAPPGVVDHLSQLVILRVGHLLEGRIVEEIFRAPGVDDGEDGGTFG